MKRFIGTKLINAVPMTLLAYNEFRGLDLPAGENGDDEGYLTEVIGSYKNTHEYNGYVQWISAESFEFDEYLPVDNMPFGLAIEALKKGKRVARAGWNGKGMYVVLVEATIQLNQHFELLNVHGTFDTWVPSVSDALAEDWQIIN